MSEQSRAQKTQLIRKRAAPGEPGVMLGDDIVEEVVVQWDKERNDLTRSVTRKCGSLRLDERVGPATPGPAYAVAMTR